MAAIVSFGCLQAAEVPPPPAAPKYRNETHWVVESTGREVSELVIFAKRKLAAGKEAASPDSANAPINANLTVSTHAWDTRTYLQLAKAMLEQWKIEVPEQKTPANSRLLQRLCSASLQELIVESRHVSEQLSQNPLDAELHEQAALVLGSFGLREAAGTFADTRPTLCRMTAHLTLARSLREKPQVCGQVAETILLCLVNRQKEALEKIALFPKEQSAWAAALKTRATGDWRVVANPERASFIEQAEHGRALVKSVDATALRSFLAKMNAQSQPEWSRIVMEHFFGVEDGHVFVRGSIALELQDLKKDWEAWSGKKLDEAKMVENLNAPAGGCVVKGADGKASIAVLSWADFAAFHQRHICQSVDRTLYFLHEMWGVPDVARRFYTEMGAKLSGLRLYAFVRARWAATSQEYSDAIAQVLKQCTTQPELVTAAKWVSASKESSLGDQFRQLPSPKVWFSPVFPANTAYEFDTRYRSIGMPSGLASWEKLKAIAPYEFPVLQLTARYKYPGNQTLQQVEESFGNISAYNIEAMRQIASVCKDDPKEYLTHMRRACDLCPNLYLSLASYLVDKHMPKEAAYAYQAAFERATDRVAMSNNCEWIVNYYFENGRKEDAVKIAADAAEVYSYSGLGTMARLMERMNKPEETEKYLRQIMERYDDVGPLLDFCLRHKEANPKLVETIKSLTAEVFPDGMRKVKLSDFTGPPKDGVVVRSTNANTDKAGLKIGDVFVALDGYRVQTVEQYMLVRGLTNDPKIVLILWDGAKYVEISTSVPGRRFGNNITTFRSGGR